MTHGQLSDISGIGPSAAEILRQGGFRSVEQVAGATVTALATLSGFGPIRAARTIEAAKAVLGASAETTFPRGKVPSMRKKTKAGKKAKDKKSADKKSADKKKKLKKSKKDDKKKSTKKSKKKKSEKK